MGKRNLARAEIKLLRNDIVRSLERPHTLESVDDIVRRCREHDLRHRACPEPETMAYHATHPGGLRGGDHALRTQKTALLCDLELIRSKVLSQGAQLANKTPAEFGAFIRAELAKWTDIIKTTGVRAD